MLAVHPHREPDEAPPEIGASVEGPGWTAPFSDGGVGGVCEGHRFEIGPATCLRAGLPEPIRPTVEYRLRGTAPLGSFTGEATVPSAPIVVEPADTLRLPLPDSGHVRIPLRYRVDPETGVLSAEVLVTESGAGTRTWREGLGIVGADTVEVGQRGDPLRVHLRLQGIGWNYADFVKHAGRSHGPPWPSFGVEGEGVYGYFDGVSAPSRVVYVLVGETTARAAARAAARARSPPTREAEGRSGERPNEASGVS